MIDLIVVALSDKLHVYFSLGRGINSPVDCDASISGYNYLMSKRSPIFPGPMTARGAVLAVLLSNSDQTGSEPMRGRITLAAIVRALKRKYHWPIETESFPSNAFDGRATWATVYSLPPAVITAALNAGGRDWLDSRRAGKGQSQQVQQD